MINFTQIELSIMARAICFGHSGAGYVKESWPEICVGENFNWNQISHNLSCTWPYIYGPYYTNMTDSPTKVHNRVERVQITAHNITSHQIAKNTAATEALLNLDILK